MNKSIKLFIAALISLSLAYIYPSIIIASEQTKTNIAVSDFAGKNVSAADASIVSDFIRTELVKSCKYDVVDKSNMDKILAESSFQQSGNTESEYAVRLGKILNVNKIVVGSLSKLEGIYYITTNFVDVQTGKIERSETAKCNSADELMNVSYDLADKYCEHDYSNTSNQPSQSFDRRKHSSSSSSKFFFGIGNPYASFGCDWTPKFTTELRYAADTSNNANKVQIYLVRLYYHFPSVQKYTWYTTIDYGAIVFQGFDASTAPNTQTKRGYMAGAYVGGKYYITKNINISMDIGPSYINIEGDVTGIEWILNTGINIYLF